MGGDSGRSKALSKCRCKPFAERSELALSCTTTTADRMLEFDVVGIHGEGHNWRLITSQPCSGA